MERVPDLLEFAIERIPSVVHQQQRERGFSCMVGWLEIGFWADFEAVAFIKSDPAAAEIGFRQFGFQDDAVLLVLFEPFHDTASVASVPDSGRDGQMLGKGETGETPKGQQTDFLSVCINQIGGEKGIVVGHMALPGIVPSFLAGKGEVEQIFNERISGMCCRDSFHFEIFLLVYHDFVFFLFGFCSRWEAASYARLVVCLPVTGCWPEIGFRCLYGKKRCLGMDDFSGIFTFADKWKIPLY